MKTFVNKQRTSYSRAIVDTDWHLRKVYLRFPEEREEVTYEVRASKLRRMFLKNQVNKDIQNREDRVVNLLVKSGYEEVF